MGFKIKYLLAIIFNYCGINNILFFLLNLIYHKKYIRIINYHHLDSYNIRTFEKQLQFYNKKFQNINYQSFIEYFNSKNYIYKKPGLLITFDDGYEDNYINAIPLLNKYNMKGFFMVSSDLIDKEGYMSKIQIQDLLTQGHAIGCHTSTHHRMNEVDTDEVLNYEIIKSKKKLEEYFQFKIDIFCWCGGESNTYTKKAAELIKKAGYKYSFMTNSAPVTFKTPSLQMQRTNIEGNWPIFLVKFQLSGFIDILYAKKRSYVCKLTK